MNINVPVSCFGKIKYSSHGEAIEVTRRIQKTKSKTKGRFNDQRAYQCEVCHNWHLGRGKYRVR